MNIQDAVFNVSGLISWLMAENGQGPLAARKSGA
jgi:hypothetical protein